MSKLLKMHQFVLVDTSMLPHMLILLAFHGVSYYFSSAVAETHGVFQL